MKSLLTKLENRLFIALLCLLVWLPLPLGSNRPWAEAIFEIWVAVLCLLWITGFQRKLVMPGESFKGSQTVLYVLVIWLIYVLLQLLPLPVILRQVLSPESLSIYQLSGESGWAPLSLYPYATFLFWLKSVAYVALFALMLLLVNSKQRLVILGYTLVFSAVFQALYGSVMTLSGLEYGFFVKKVAYLGNATGTFVNRNHLAGYLEMVSAIGIGLLMATAYQKQHVRSWRQRLRNLISLMLSQKLLLRLMLATMVIALVLTRSRMGNTGFFSSMLITGLITLLVFRKRFGSFSKMFKRSDTRSTVLLISSLIVIDLFIVGTWFGVEKVAQRISASSVSHDSDRIEVSENTLSIVKDYPLIGTGGGSFSFAYPHYRGESIERYYDHAHEDYLEMLSEVGVIGFSLLALVVLLSMWAALKALLYRHDKLMQGMAFASIMATIALLIHSTVDFNLQIPANAATFMVILALGWLALNLDRSSELTDNIKNQEFMKHGK